MPLVLTNETIGSTSAIMNLFALINGSLPDGDICSAFDLISMVYSSGTFMCPIVELSLLKADLWIFLVLKLKIGLNHRLSTYLALKDHCIYTRDCSQFQSKDAVF